MKNLLFIIFLFAMLLGRAQEKSTFSIFLDPEECNTQVKYQSEYKELIDSVKGTRTIVSNNIPNHSTGNFPNSGNPNSIKPQKQSYTLDLFPEKSKKITQAKGMSFGVMLNGVEIDPYTNEFFRGTNGTNKDWNINGLTNSLNLGTDCNNAHVQPNGKYHYHGTPSAFLEELGMNGSSMIKVGYAADGFPIYYKFGYAENGELIELTSGYVLKEGERGGDGKSAPNGSFDGTYFQDYRYINDVSLLDECNGIVGRTPENEEEYYYVITDNFPSSPLCLSGAPSDDFKIRHEIGGQRPPGGRNGSRQRPSSEQLMNRMDSNNDGKLAKDEVMGPLQNDFDQLDTNSDGYLTIEELEKAKPPNGRPD